MDILQAIWIDRTKGEKHIRVKVRERPDGIGAWWVFIDYKGRRKAKKIRKKASAKKVAAAVQQ